MLRKSNLSLKSLNCQQKRFNSHAYAYNLPGFKAEKFQHLDTDLSTYPAHYRYMVNLVSKGNYVNWYLELMGYRKYGLHFEDIIIEYRDVGEALCRVPKESLSDRDDRFKEALVLSSGGNILPQERWVTEQEDKPYLFPYLAQVVQERRDREAFRPL